VSISLEDSEDQVCASKVTFSIYIYLCSAKDEYLNEMYVITQNA